MLRRVSFVPALCRVFDYLTVSAVLLAVTVLVSGGFREWLPWGRVSVTSWGRPLIIALVLTAVRHWLQPRPSLLTALDAWRRRVARSEAVRAATPIAFSTRAAVLLIGFLAVVLFGYRADVLVPWRIYENEFLNLPARWDTGWYMDVATDGYRWMPARTAIQQNIAFFPVYPMLMRYGSLFFGREMMWTGVLISWASFFAALVFLYRLARERLDGDAATASLALLATYPFALFFSTAYTESLFLLTIVAACFYMERGALWQAACWGFVAGLSRPNGCLLSIPLALIAVRPLWPFEWRRMRVRDWAGIADRVAVAALPGIGMLCYSTFIYFLTGHPFQWASQNAAWGRVYRGLDALFAEHAQSIGDHGIYNYAATRTVDALQLTALGLFLASLWPVWRRIGFPYAALVAVNIVTPLLMGGLISMGRVTSVLFPTFLWLGAAIPARQRPAWIAVFAMLQALCAAAFFTWRPLF
jgi:hypothetical protein